MCTVQRGVSMFLKKHRLWVGSNWNGQTGRLIRTNGQRLWQAIDKRFLLIPPLLTLGLGRLIYVGGYGGLSKYHFEVAAIVALSGFTLCLLARFLVDRHPFFLWATAFCGILLMREFHFAGTSTGAYLGLLVLLYFALTRLDKLQQYLLETRISTWLMTGLFTYFISVTIDQRWWRALPWEGVVHVRLEETLEVLGHVIIGSALLLASRPLASKTG